MARIDFPLFNAAPEMYLVLRSIVAEVSGPTPFSADSYLPAHLVEQAMDAIDIAESTNEE